MCTGIANVKVVPSLRWESICKLPFMALATSRVVDKLKLMLIPSPSLLIYSGEGALITSLIYSLVIKLPKSITSTMRKICLELGSIKESCCYRSESGSLIHGTVVEK